MPPINVDFVLFDPLTPSVLFIVGKTGVSRDKFQFLDHKSETT